MCPVDSSLIITALQAAEDRVAIGARQIWKQRGFVARLEREGEDTTEATALLREMQRTQESHTAHRDQLRNPAVPIDLGIEINCARSLRC